MLTALLPQAKRALVIARKDTRIYYSKGPVIIFGILSPIFLFLAFTIGKELTFEFVMPGLLGMILFFTATAISPAVAPWETQARTLERLMSCPVTIPTIILGDILASFAYGLAISLVPILIGIIMGISVHSPIIFAAAIILAAFCFSSLGLLFAVVPTSTPSTIMMLTTIVKFPIVFISGIFIPLSQLPPWGLKLSYISPVTYFTDIARHCIQGQGYLPIHVDFLALGAFTALFLVLAIKLHQRTMPRRV